MKKIFTLVVAFMALNFAVKAQDVCVVDNTNTVFGITPNDSLAPPIIRGVAFDTVAQIYVPSSYTVNYQGIPVTATIHWLNIDSVTGFPTGINFQRNPGVSDTIYGGGRQCILLSGNTMDTVGTYNINFFGHVRITALIYDTTVPLSLVASQFGYFLKVEGGVGIHNVGSTFNASLNVFPNPTSGKFDLTLKNVGTVNGDIVVMDMTGRRVYTQKLEAAGFYNTSIDLSGFAKGLYTVQVRTAEGTASKNISVE